MNVKTGGTLKHVLKNIDSVPYNINIFTNVHQNILERS
jgi:hypothetical protein